MDAADAALAELDYAGALAHADAAGLDRFSERAQRTAMLALYALGRQHEALQAYRRFCALIDCELGLEPAAQTRALHSAILRQDDVRVLLPRPIERAHRDAGERSVRLLGRAGELGTLERAARQALGGSLALLLIEGEAGLGKTRLLDELAARLDGVRVGQASCSELERHLPYVPLAAALRDALPRAESVRAAPGGASQDYARAGARRSAGRVGGDRGAGSADRRPGRLRCEVHAELGGFGLGGGVGYRR